MAGKTIRAARDQIGRVFTQRCFYLFTVLLAMIGIVPFVEGSDSNRLVLGAIDVLIMIAAVAAVGRTLLSFVIMLLLAGAAMVSQYLGVTWGDAEHLARGWGFTAALYLATIVYMLRYVFLPEVMTTDKLFGAAATYLMMGALWTFAYALVGYAYPGSFVVAGAPGTPDIVDTMYFSFTVLTSTGFGDIVPLSRQARALCVLEQLSGALFLAILIARLAGVYPSSVRDRHKTESKDDGNGPLAL